MNFGLALRKLKTGKAFTRRGWAGTKMFIKIKYPEKNSEMDVPYLYIQLSNGEKIPFSLSNVDLFANDWEEATE